MDLILHDVSPYISKLIWQHRKWFEAGVWILITGGIVYGSYWVLKSMFKSFIGD